MRVLVLPGVCLPNCKAGRCVLLVERWPTWCLRQSLWTRPWNVDSPPGGWHQNCLSSLNGIQLVPRVWLLHLYSSASSVWLTVQHFTGMPGQLYSVRTVKTTWGGVLRRLTGSWSRKSFGVSVVAHWSQNWRTMMLDKPLIWLLKRLFGIRFDVITVGVFVWL